MYVVINIIAYRFAATYESVSTGAPAPFVVHSVDISSIHCRDSESSRRSVSCLLTIGPVFHHRQ